MTNVPLGPMGRRKAKNLRGPASIRKRSSMAEPSSKRSEVRIRRVGPSLRGPPNGTHHRMVGLEDSAHPTVRSHRKSEEPIMNSSISGTLLIGALAVVLARPARAEELDPKYKEVVNKGLD